MIKCVYCNKEVETPYSATCGEDNKTVTCGNDDCAKRTEAFFRFGERAKPFFTVGIIISLIFIFVSVIFLTIGKMVVGSILIGTGFALVGLTMLIFPLATPQTYSMYGIRKTTLITRIIGLCIVIAGPLLALYVMS